MKQTKSPLPSPAALRGGGYKPRSKRQWQVTNEIIESVSPELNELLNEASITAPRQFEMAILLAKGLSDNQISMKLEINIYTVEHHIFQLAKALDIMKQSELVKLVQAHQYGLDES